MRLSMVNTGKTGNCCVRAAVLYQLSYEDPDMESRANLLSSSTRKRNETYDERCELRQYK